MSEPPPRPVETIDADLRSCRALWRDAEMELAEVRRRQAELLELEATLLAAMDMRGWRADRLLDERLLAAAVADPRGPAGPEQRPCRQVATLDGLGAPHPVGR
ncbi:hypothetical protein FHU33_2027 [Blastococcus colisei]|uniref:Uncharacterized protein n=1 Tax=Blastococcus colisei TaxID=1564162 RepID=A0A543PEX1_9ACTN|nr:hypothetical protein [Blastococcus colisei]TQN42621.1 hypothetical protein FHU33_2027 [Blastococcus colisei]